jgi:hypothetical protein
MTTRPAARAPAPGGYSLVLPPGWLRLAARGDEGERYLAAVLDDAFAELPRDSAAPVRAELEKRVLGALAEARRAGALDLYLPLLGVRGRALPASVVVAETELPDPLPGAGGGLEADAEAVAALLAGVLAGAPGGTVIALPVGPCGRVEEQVPPGDRAEGLGVRRVTYHLPVPHDGRRWIVVTCSVADGLEPMTSTVVGLFDALLTTWRWRPPA